jgi:sarcosine oxidase, subunit gamma
VSSLVLDVEDRGARLGLKGPRAGEWLLARGLVVPAAPNTWTRTPCGDAQLLVARLGQSEFFLEDCSAGSALEGVAGVLSQSPSGVYPVLREDFAFELAGEGVHEALAQVCNVNFAGLDLAAQPVIMTLMIGVSVLVLPEQFGGARRYRFWCDPTFGPSLSENLAAVVVECGGTIRGASA